MLGMKEIILEYLNDEFYFYDIDNSVFSVSNNTKTGYQQIETNIIKMFNIDDDIAHAIVFNWLLFNGVKLVKKNWNKSYLVHNKNITINFETSITENVDFIYKLIPNE